MLKPLHDLGKILMLIGLAIAALGLLINSASGRGWFGRLPGDIHWSQGDFSLHFPIVTCILVSLLLTFLMWFFRR
ncbi:MAG: hypothetical protein M2R45_01667 [Verrucomicrobia subdivision 3 bacterium]|nr:hypothetical protein [Limisphaerales bacterium]MCS1412818.1 hypothetical protein [Limisphaerales bacterium]